MASWRERRAWRAEFRQLGVRQVSERERQSVWQEEKLQEARRWLREQEWRPRLLIALAAALAGVLATALMSGLIK
jgi:hypothetical protein